LPKFFHLKDKKKAVPEKCDFPDLIDYWRGFEMINLKGSAGIFVNVDSATKFLLGESIYQ